ncbi:type I restriction endonuclease subunit R [Streptococcus sp. H31]|uniref:type I restriction endonuclease subunit R n=1 Tax=Streptococcus huangxiaojuni TaxID=3237239 RepID=UPI0034A1F472
MVTYEQQRTTLPVAEMPNGIIIEEFVKTERYNRDVYQTEEEMEEQLLKDLISGQHYEPFTEKTTTALLLNLRQQLQRLNDITFTDVEWQRFLDEYLDKVSDGMIEKTRKIQENHIYDFIFDDGRIKNIMLIDKKNIHRNHLQVANQITQKGSYKNRYDVTILVNGLPLVQIELKKRGVPMKEAFEQIHRYSKESFNTQHSLFQYIQLFVVSNGTRTRYFANTTAQNKNHFEFTCEWADKRNQAIHDLEDFAQTFLNKQTLLSLLTKYCIFDANDTLLVMRPYQIAATESILHQIHIAHENKRYGSVDAGGFVWHTTGSGKTLTSFKTARLATELDYIDKVFFVVDRKDLDYQTMKEYQKFQKDSVNGSKNTKELKKAIEKDDSKIVVTTIQKLNEFLKNNPMHPILEKQCVLIYDECHRSQFGSSQKKIQSGFKNYYQFGFTGTPIFKENSLNGQMTADVFGRQLHAYIITDAIRDQKVLKFKVDYNYVKPELNQFREAEQTVGEERDEKQLTKIENETLLHPSRIAKVSEYLLRVFDDKTHRRTQYTFKRKRLNGFNAMFAVQSVKAAKAYYEELNRQQADLPDDRRLKIATIFSYTPNEEQSAYGTIVEEGFEPTYMDLTSKEFLAKAIGDYNQMFRTNFSTESKEFQNYYKDLSQRVKNKEVELLIVVGMFLTGFDAPTMNTLFVDKNLRFHGLIQAFSRTNRILSKEKPFGNIVCFRDLEKATVDAIKRFGDPDGKGNENSIHVILEKSYQDYVDGFVDEETGQSSRGYREICQELLDKYPDPTEIYLESEKREFVQLFGDVLKMENILRNYDEFVEEGSMFSPGLMQDMRSVYVDIREEAYGGNRVGTTDSGIDFSDIEFEIELLKTEEINLDYIINLISEKSKTSVSKDDLKSEMTRVIRSSIDMRSKEELVLSFINDHNQEKLQDEQTILESFYTYARQQKEVAIQTLAEKERLKGDYRHFIKQSLIRGYVPSGGTELNELMPPTSRRKGARERKKQEIYQQLQELVETYKGI